MEVNRRWNDFNNLALRDKLSMIIVLGAFASVIFMLVLLSYWAFWPYKTLTVQNPKMEKTVVYQGDVVNYSTDYVKYMPSVSVQRFFIDGLIFDAGKTTLSRPLGSGHGVQSIQIPRTLPPGKYYLHVVVTFKPNPIREIEYSFNTNEFVVRASNDPDSEFDQ